MEYKKTIFITGGAGFIGSNYLNSFVIKYRDYFFINIDALTYAGNLKNIKVVGEKNYFFEKCDIRDLLGLEVLFKKYKPTDIIHFAAESHVDFSIENPSLFVETNINGTHNLLFLAKKYDIRRFHQISTDEVYGSLNTSDKSFTRSSAILPNSPYSASKAAADLLVRSYNKTFGLDVVITRCSNNYGPNQDSSKLIPKTILNLLSGKKVPVYGRGQNIRDWIYVQDHIEAIDLVFHKGSYGMVYNIGGDCEINNLDLVGRIIKLMSKEMSSIDFVSDRAGHDFRYAIDSSEIFLELGWKPKVAFEEGIKKTIEYYEKNF